MTVTYTAEVATGTNYGCFLKLLARWKGSLYKLIWKDLIVFLVLYYVLNILYRFFLNNEAKIIFENLAHYCHSYSTLIPLSFVLGFYVSIVMQRWWDQYMTIPWPDPLAVFVSAQVHGLDERGRVMRRTVMRYVCLCLTIVFTMISERVKKRFPTLSHLVEAGLLLENEKEVIEGMDRAFPKHPKHWMPIVWAASIITRARKEGRIRDDFAVKTIIDELNKFRGMCGVLMYYDTISVPLVYTQVVTIAVYTYFLCSVMGQQWLEKSDKTNYRNVVDFYFPVFTTLQFCFYMGWLKVAESLINPFGDDDDDFEINWMVDRNLQVSYLIVDEMHDDHPQLVKDQYWDEVFPNEIPYANDVDMKREDPPETSTAKLDFSLSTVKIDKNSSNHQVNGKSQRESSLSLQNPSSASHWSITRRRFSRDNTSNLDSKQVAIEKQDSSSNSSIRPVANGQVAKPSVITRFSDTQIEEADERQSLEDQQSTIFPNMRQLFKQDSAQNAAPNSSDDEKDEFDRLREERERARTERHKQKFALGITTIIPATSGVPSSLVQLPDPASISQQNLSQATSRHASGVQSSENVVNVSEGSTTNEAQVANSKDDANKNNQEHGSS